MAIPISEYISIGNTVLGTGTGTASSAGLVFTSTAMLAEVPSAYATTKAAYEAGTVVSMSKDDIDACFNSASDIVGFATAYFGVASNVTTLHVAKILAADTDSEAAFNRVTETQGFTNFRSFTLLGKTLTADDSLVDIATANAGNGFQYLMFIPTLVSTASADSADVMNIAGCHLVQCANATDYLVARCMAWAASIDYNQSNASSTLMYKNLGTNTATVSTLAGKTTADALRVNYIGDVQTHGIQRKFYQKGVNMDGMDAGVFLDAAWLSGQIESGWFGLVGSVGKVPANVTGSSMVRGMVVGVAQRALENGIILADKPLTETQEIEVNQYANNTAAAGKVNTTGYYVDTKIVADGDDYVCQYILIYAKADNIVKVVGSHILV